MSDQPREPLDVAENHVHAAALHLEATARALEASGRPILTAVRPISIELGRLLDVMHRESSVIRYAAMSDQDKAAALLAAFAPVGRSS